MEEHKKNLKIISYVIIILAIFNIVLLGIGFANGQLKQEVEERVQDTMVQSGASAEEIEQAKDVLLNISFYGSISGVVIGVLFKIYLGVKGLSQADGKVKGKGNIVLATVVLVCSIISVCTSIMPLIRKEISTPSFVSSVCGLIVIAYYVVAASKVVKAVESGENEKEAETK